MNVEQRKRVESKWKYIHRGRGRKLIMPPISAFAVPVNLNVSEAGLSRGPLVACPRKKVHFLPRLRPVPPPPQRGLVPPFALLPYAVLASRDANLYTLGCSLISFGLPSKHRTSYGGCKSWVPQAIPSLFPGDTPALLTCPPTKSTSISLCMFYWSPTPTGRAYFGKFNLCHANRKILYFYIFRKL